MNVVHLSTYDINGGAARAAWRVHDSLRRAGVSSSMFVGFRDSHDPAVTQYVPGSAPAPRLARVVRRDYLRWQLRRASKNRPPGFEDFRDDRSIYAGDVARLAPPADVYHLHQITDFLDYRASLSPLAARAPIVWSLHEMTPFTGGCHYAYDCRGFEKACGACPQLGSSDPRDLSRAVWTRKHGVFERIPPDRMQVVGTSQWIASEARASSLLGRFPVSVIPSGVDTDVFRPMREARGLLAGFGLRPSTRVVLFVVDWTGNPRKGFAELDAALGALRHPDAALVSLGRGDAPRLQSRLPHIHLGGMSEDRMIAAVYSMADVFVIPSLEDNLPNTVLEAIACGTPVVGFRAGGIPDMVRQGENGLTAPVGDVTALAQAIDTVLSDDLRRASMGARARAIAEREYTLALQAARYLDLYRSFGDQRPRRAVAADVA